MNCKDCNGNGTVEVCRRHHGTSCDCSGTHVVDCETCDGAAVFCDDCKERAPLGLTLLGSLEVCDACYKYLTAAA